MNPMCSQQIQNVFQNRFIYQFDHRFRAGGTNRAQSDTLSACHNIAFIRKIPP
jgi:hypothetical protein